MRAGKPSRGGMPELVFAEACEEGENGLCPVTTFDFGTVATGSSGPYPDLFLVNQSGTTSATGLSLQSDTEFPFTPKGNGCQSSDELPPGTWCPLSVKFAPTAPGPVLGTLIATSSEGAEATLTLTGTGGNDVLLYGQAHDWATMPAFFSILNASYLSTPEFSSELAADFLVEDPEGWTVNTVTIEALADTPGGDAPAFDVYFMPDDGGLPSEVVLCAAPASQVVFWDEAQESRAEIALSALCLLPPGHYWLRARPVADDVSLNQFFWGLQYLLGSEEEPPGEPPLHLNAAVWRNPGGVISDCPDWTHIYPPACGLEVWWPFFAAYDAVFWLVGQVGEVVDPVLRFDPLSLDFGEVAVGSTSAPRSATLHNIGNDEATELAFSLPDSRFDADTSGCGDALPVGASCEIAVTFTPAALGPAATSLHASSAEAASAALSLTAIGVGGAVFIPDDLEVDPDPFFSDGNGILEPGEVVEVAPAWRNNGIDGASVIGTASHFTGPGGASYPLLLRDADYGVVDAGHTASCSEATGVCFWLGVGTPTARPATHWEATFDEELSEGTTKTWMLHIGDSFADVPRGSPFYTAVETLLHHGVTGSCGGTEYCPTATNTRGQMAVFLLKAAEGGDYVLPVCVEGAESFADVPFDSPLCPWIEELAARGVTAGCGGGNYCPGAPVSRAQMAVFLLKAFEGDGYTPQECTGMFTDVTCPSTFAAWVEELAARGVTGGCGGEPPTYCPTAPVTRAQMAVFVAKTFGLTLYGP